MAGGRVMRKWKRKLSSALARHVVNPMMRAALDRGIAPRGYALLETTGRKSGLPRRTPVGNGTDGDTFWIVAEHGRSAAYVRNIEADPRVRVKVGRRWRSGIAHLLPDDDPRQRQRLIGRTFNAAVVRLMGTELLTVRVDLDASTIEERGGTSRPIGGEHPSVPKSPHSDVTTAVAPSATAQHSTAHRSRPSTDGTSPGGRRS
jgi:deazaflavin-dependent oxidoreductase (nitroreductase family)